MATLNLFLLLVRLLWPAPEVPLVLRAASPDFGPVLFSVATVRDERPGQPAVALLLPAGTGAAVRPVELRGGTTAALQQFAAATLPAVPANRYAITLRVLELRVRETPGPHAAAANGTVALHLAFEWRNAAGQTVTLTEYRGGARYGRARANRAVVEAALGQALLGSLRYFNGWLGTAGAHDVRLATSVRPTFHYDTRQTEPDTLFYDPTRPLNWTDFMGAPRAAMGPYAAAIFPSFGYQARPRVRNGVLELDIELNVFVVRSSSWVAEGQRKAYNLNHEQRHFDLVRLVAERFRRKASPDSLTVADYQSILGWQYLDSFREMNRLQDQYDHETHGGTDTVAQSRWNQRIDAELRGFGVR
ncbi:hypothetical protein [Hymenobacter psychrophilus]|uniref:DUF922 domain-containing protein n=1 Tax=Hymenobacter psychrophilus TaxID=651662 RepID=A0A1H3JTT9_9BACT|nr:hypothetical protein [Hymenobacter psychrophilus]SDY43367.1 hypothetical protein SAMN04488069_108214 [Hymenobacter psychrophilus]